MTPMVVGVIKSSKSMLDKANCDGSNDNDNDNDNDNVFILHNHI